MGCCTSCSGTGSDQSAPETGGRCWDCYGSGCCHLGPCDAAFERRCRWVLIAVLAWIILGNIAVALAVLLTH